MGITERAPFPPPENDLKFEEPQALGSAWSRNLVLNGEFTV